ncbi:putative nucleotidyltransferase substrate binding domain-containing protein [Magnetofaba australis]|nr:putative nucleotidyltransferase substrate binding domain-containing protein [Magnetofaba australis]
MDVELLEIRDFLLGLHPFDLLPANELDNLPAKLEATYVRRDAEVLKPGGENHFLYIIRSGAVETHGASDELLARMGVGEVFGVRAIMAGGRIVNRSAAIEDTLLYRMPREEFERLCGEYQQFRYFFDPLGAQRLREAKAAREDQNDDAVGRMGMPVQSMLKRKVVAIAPNASITEAAQLMSEERVSCLIVQQADGRLEGILTDRDLRSRVLAKGLTGDQIVGDIMTRDPVGLALESTLSDAQLAMMRHNVHHLPVVSEENHCVGVVTASTLTLTQPASAVHLIGELRKSNGPEEMAAAMNKLPEVLVNLVNMGAASSLVGKMITAVSDSVAVRLIELAQERLGPSPIPFCWVVGGSQARHEQTGVSDQDNALLLDDAYDPERHGEYFENLAIYMRDGLEACGYYLCPGDMMATNPEWRQTLSKWKEYFTHWIDEPDRKALMLTSVWFDLRMVWGEATLFAKLREHIVAKSKGNNLFLAYMASNALTHTPPLGFFKNFVLINKGEHKDTLDLKHNGVVPIVDLARVAALASGSESVNTMERLASSKEAGVISTNGVEDLRDAMEFINDVRLRHQARSIQHGAAADNYIPPDELSHFERNHLKDAFSVVKTIQSAIGNRFQVGRFA